MTLRCDIFNTKTKEKIKLTGAEIFNSKTKKTTILTEEEKIEGEVILFFTIKEDHKNHRLLAEKYMLIGMRENKEETNCLVNNLLIETFHSLSNIMLLNIDFPEDYIHKLKDITAYLRKVYPGQIEFFYENQLKN